MAQKASAPAMDRMDPEPLIRSPPILVSRSAVVVERDLGAGGEPQVVLFTFAEPPGEGAVLAPERPRPGSGLAFADQDG